MQGYGEQSAEEKQRLLMLFKSMSFNGVSGMDLYNSTSFGGGTSSLYSSELRGEFGAGLLDLHSIEDTELISEHFASESYEQPYLMSNSSPDDEFDKLQKALPESNRVLPSGKEYGGKESNVSKIKVVVRKRPLNKKEKSRGEDDVVTVNDGTLLTVHEPKLKVDLTAYVEKHEFCFDSVLDEDVSNDKVYQITVEPIISSLFHGTKATCFAYGQTGSGKTFTMQPLPLRASEDMLRLLNKSMYCNQRLKMWLSYFEIYGGKLYDLLSDRRKLCMREDGRQQVCIVGLQEFEVSDTRTVREYIEKGNAARSTGSTGANEESSRSHAILQLIIKKHAEPNSSKRGKDSAAKNTKLVGKISFIDLAGSERGADTTDNDRQTRIEGAEINKSLLALKECIRALDNDQNHIPFRGSKLTEVLRDSFVGNSRTVMISCISPNAGSCEHTLNTLRYADRVKSLSRGGNPRRDQPSQEPIPADTMIKTPDMEEIRPPVPPLSPPRAKVNAGTKRDIVAEETELYDEAIDEILAEEEALISAHRKAIEDTMDIVREEMKLLAEVDQPGSLIDDYVGRLGYILSRKVAGLMGLQARLARFQHRLKEQDILSSRRKVNL